MHVKAYGSRQALTAVVVKHEAVFEREVPSNACLELPTLAQLLRRVGKEHLTMPGQHTAPDFKHTT